MSTVRVSNVSKQCTETTLKEFFSYSGTIASIELAPAASEEDATSDDSAVQVALVTFEDPTAIDTALMLSGATIMDREVTIEAVGSAMSPAKKSKSAGEVVASLIAQGYMLTQQIVEKAKKYDDEHQLTARASAKIAEVQVATSAALKDADAKLGVSEKMKNLNEQYKLQENMNKIGYSVAGKINEAQASIESNETFQKGKAALFTGAQNLTERFNSMTTQVSQKVNEQVEAMKNKSADS